MSLHQKIIKVQCLILTKEHLVVLVYPVGDLFEVDPSALGVILRGEQLGFCGTYCTLKSPRIVGLWIKTKLLQTALYQTDLVAIIVDHIPGVQPNRPTIPTQNGGADSMKRTH